ncbi:MAG TPA: ATP synthase F0 subunit B [Candidatus Kryptonia bacterium]|nr:ATP synthase F0 subunit B [Candidatus Kryptonia bacterium]
MSRRGGVDLLIALAWLLPIAAWASEHEEAHEHGGIPWGTLLFNLVNFSIFCWIIARFALPVVRDWVRARHDRIVDELGAAAKARAEAEQLKAQWDARLKALDQEIARIRADAAADAGRERDRILDAARKTAEAIRNDARRAADQEIRRAQAELRDSVAREAVTLATQLVRDRLTPADQDRFVSEFLGQVKA